MSSRELERAYAAKAGWLLLGLALAGCAGSGEEGGEAPAAKPLRWRGQAMGTVWQVQLGSDAQETRNPPQLAVLIREELARLDRIFSTWRNDSEIARFNAAPAGFALPVCPDLARVLQCARRVGELSHGALDIGCGAAVQRWGFGPPDAKTGARATDSAAAAPRLDGAGEGYRWEEGAVKLQKLRTELKLDFSALVKGYAIDRMAELLEARGCRDYLVEFGGEVRARGLSPRGRPWRVGLEAPEEHRAGEVRRTITLSSQAVATSGDYRNYRLTADGRVSHLIDPRTGRPIAHALTSVSVVHSEAMWADAWATALMVLGPDEGWRVACEQGLPAWFVERSDGAWTERVTPAAQKAIQ